MHKVLQESGLKYVAVMPPHIGECTSPQSQPPNLGAPLPAYRVPANKLAGSGTQCANDHSLFKGSIRCPEGFLPGADFLIILLPSPSFPLTLPSSSSSFLPSFFPLPSIFSPHFLYPLPYLPSFSPSFHLFVLFFLPPSSIPFSLSYSFLPSFPLPSGAS